MNGVEILNQSEIIIQKDGHGLLVGVICFFLISIFTVILFAHLLKDTESGFYSGMLCGLVLGTAIGIITECNTRQDILTGQYEYQVIISEDVKITDFLKKYEIIKQDGKIYTVIERE